MKPKLLFLLSVLFVADQLHSQAYTKIPTDPNYFWRQISDCNFQYQIRYYKDTIIRGLTYGKYSLFGATIGTACGPSFVKDGYIRQDSLNRRVVVLDANFDEQPLYNFNKVAGDTLLIYDRVSDTNLTYTVQSTNVNQTFQTLVRNNYTYFIAQGIGSLMGGLYACQQSFSPIMTDKFVCFGKINPYQVLQPPEVGFEGMCYIITGQEDQLLDNLNLNLFPNPANSAMRVEFDPSANVDKLTLTNALGQTICEILQPTAKQDISIVTLRPGIYFLKAENKNGQRSFKILKE